MKNLIPVFLVLFSSVDAAEPPELSHNPFSRPPSEISARIRGVPTPDGSAQALDLRATRVMSNSRLANVVGHTMRPGDEVQGYTLLQVFEDRAIFVRDGKRLTIYVKPDPEDDDYEIAGLFCAACAPAPRSTTYFH